MTAPSNTRRRFVAIAAYGILVLFIPILILAAEVTSRIALGLRGETQYPLVYIAPEPVKTGVLTNQPWFNVLDPLLGHAYAVDFLQKGMPEFRVSEGFVAYADPTDKTRLRIFVLGGSTTEPYFMMRAEDPTSYSHDSWPFFLQKRLDELGIPAVVFNGGVAGYSTNQELLKLIRDVLPMQPDIVLSLSGVNDQGFAHSDKTHPMIHPYQVRVFSALAGAREPSRIFPNLIALAHNLTATDTPLAVTFGPEVHTAPWTQWERNLHLMHAVCAESSAQFIAFRQPSLGVGHQTPSAEEEEFLRKYNEAVAPAGATITYTDVLRRFYKETDAVPQRLPYCVNLVDVFEGKQGMYRDARHQTAEGAAVIAESVAEKLYDMGVLQTEKTTISN